MKIKTMLLLLGLACNSAIHGQLPNLSDTELEKLADELLLGLPNRVVSDDPPVVFPLQDGSSNASDEYLHAEDPEALLAMVPHVLQQPQASSSNAQVVDLQVPKIDQKAIDDAIASAKRVNAESILQEIAADKARTAKEALAEGLKRFKAQQQVLWATNPIKYAYTVDESNYEWVDCDPYMVLETWDSSTGMPIYKVSLEIHQPDGTIIRTTINSKENPRIEAVWTGSWIDRKQVSPTKYRKKVCRAPKIVTKEAELPIRFGIYKRDIADAALLAANVAAEYCFNKYITSLRVNRIADHIIAHADDTAHFLRLVKDQLETAEKEHLASLEGKGYFERNKLRAAYLLEIPRIKEIFKTYADRIAGTSTNPFTRNFFMNMENLPVIAGRLLLNRATDYLEKHYIIPDYQHAVSQGGIAFKTDENGNLVRDNTPPISMVMLAKAIIHPKLFCQSVQRNWEAGSSGCIKALMGDAGAPSSNNLRLLSKLAGLPLPEWLLSDRAKSIAGFATEICIEGLSMKFFNDYCAQQWVEYLGTNHQELLALIEKYQKAKEQNPQDGLDVKNAEEEIRKFVQTAHDPSWFFPAKYWYMRFLTDYTTKSKVKNMIMGSAVAVAAWKAWSWWKSSGTTK